MADNRKAYGLAKEQGIDTTGMSPKEVWQALKEKGVTQDETYSDGNGGTYNPSDEEKKKLKEQGINLDDDKDEKSKAEFFGEEFKGYKGQSAIDKLLKEKRGYIKGAFHRDDIGDIDLVWGDDYIGLQHIIVQREKEKEGHWQEILNHLVTSIEKGEFQKRNEKGNFEFVNAENNVKYFTIIAPEYHGNKITFVLSAFRRGKKIKH